uniref:Uteroferrin-associated basic protein 2 n=1 Tax=Sus scrofa TaxID=9823 RepID=UFAP2_PIG|nr:RecName: Full=Uteroferrin-associated basic protein 2; Short=UABP-2; Flags: Precursor [Sus scrofa]CAA44663.1 uteroferrin associated basic protein-2 [Sus scrofa]
MSHGKMPLVLSLVLILCGLFNSISCEKQQTSPKTITPVSFKRIAALSQKMEANYKAFAQELFKTLLIEDPRKNMIFSPVSISISLATLSLGLRSATRTNAIDVLERDLRNLRVWDKHQALQHLVEMLHELEKKKQLKHKDIFFIDRNKKMNQMFLKEIDRVYKVDIQMIDFKDKEKTKKAINQFVADKIDKKAKNLITHLDPQTLLCLVNYVFFKGILERAFQTNLTKKEDFFVNEKTIVQVDMMRKTERMIYSRSEELLATMVKMPCKENASIILVLPDTGKFDFALKEMAAKRARLQKTNELQIGALSCAQDQDHLQDRFKHLLPKIGINDIFTTKAVTWNTTRTSTILEAVHHAVIEVKEDGLTKNAAKDKDFWKVPVDKKEVPVVVKFDRPFFLFVEDEITRRDLFVAKVFNPKTE